MVAEMVEQSHALVATSQQLRAESQLLRIRSLELQAQSMQLCQRLVQLCQQFEQAQLVCQRADTASLKRALDQEKQYPAAIEVVSAAPRTFLADPHYTAMESLRSIRALLDHLPLEVQVAMVKALTARTIIKARERLQPPTVLSA